jgi:polyvinyl alcohol dehydrogenase (cytochrome)
VYFPDWAGNLCAVRKDSGAQIWTHKISDYDNFAGAISRVSPAVHGDDPIIGDLESSKVHNGANVMAINRHTGALRWITKVDTHPAAIINGSHVIDGDIAYVGVSSSEEELATDPAYPCCSFRGSMVAINTNTGAIVWQTFIVPDNHGTRMAIVEEQSGRLRRFANGTAYRGSGYKRISPGTPNNKVFAFSLIGGAQTVR